MELNYDKLIFLDAEELAEQGIKNAYDEILPELKKYIKTPLQIEEKIDETAGSYSVTCGEITYIIYSGEQEDNSWGTATYVLFKVVNDQLANSRVKFYAINGGNDLGGMFLTAEEAEASKKSLGNKTDWPYLPTAEEPSFGQFH